MSKEDRIGQNNIGAEGTAQTPVEELKQSILQYLGDETSHQREAFTHIAELYDNQAESMKTGKSLRTQKDQTFRKIAQGLLNDEYKREWIHIHSEIPKWYKVVTQGITDSNVREFTFVQTLVDIKNAAEARTSQQPPLQSQK
jgi:hypothetical protein